jgi:hypothetical protein
MPMYWLIDWHHSLRLYNGHLHCKKRGKKAYFLPKMGRGSLSLTLTVQLAFNKNICFYIKKKRAL